MNQQIKLAGPALDLVRSALEYADANGGSVEILQGGLGNRVRVKVDGYGWSSGVANYPGLTPDRPAIGFLARPEV